MMRHLVVCCALLSCDGPDSHEPLAPLPVTTRQRTVAEIVAETRHNAVFSADLGSSADDLTAGLAQWKQRVPADTPVPRELRLANAALYLRALLHDRDPTSLGLTRPEGLALWFPPPALWQTTPEGDCYLLGRGTSFALYVEPEALDTCLPEMVSLTLYIARYARRVGAIAYTQLQTTTTAEYELIHTRIRSEVAGSAIPLWAVAYDQHLAHSLQWALDDLQTPVTPVEPIVIEVSFY